MNGVAPLASAASAERAFYDAAIHQAAVFDLSDFTCIELRGADRQRFLHNLCTNDVVKLQPGEGCEAFVTNVQGKCVGHVWIFASESTLHVVTVPDQADTLIKHWDRYLITEDVQLRNAGDAEAHLLLSGAAAERILTRLNIPQPPARPYVHQMSTVADIPLAVARVPWLEPPSWLLRVPRSQLASLSHLLSNAGAATAERDQQRVGLAAARIENRLPLYGQDVTLHTLPQEVQRDAVAISFHKGCYLGQETIARIDALGHVNQVLRLIRCPGETVPAVGSPLTHHQQTVGQITSATYSPKFAAPIALAYIRCSALQPSTTLAVDVTTVEII